MDHETHLSVYEHSSSFERVCDVMMLCSVVFVVTAVRILQQINAVAWQLWCYDKELIMRLFVLGYSYNSSIHLLCECTLAGAHMVAETSKSVFVLRLIQYNTYQLIIMLSCLAFMLLYSKN